MPVDLGAIPARLNYDTAIDWPARLSREGPFLLRTLAPAPSRRILDLGSGTGDHVHWLAEQGFTAVGIEGVKERWEAARARAAPNAEHLLGDLGAVEAMVRGQFGAALCLGNTLPSLVGVETVARMLVGLRRRLLTGGVFVAAQLNYDRIFVAGDVTLPRRGVVVDGDALAFERTLSARADGVVEVRERALLSLPGGEERLVHQRHLFQQGWREDELLTLLDVAGFRDVEAWGGFGGEAFDRETSSELVLVAASR